MRIHGFDWDEENENHLAKHGVTIFEVEETILFCKPLYQRSKEGKYIAYGATKEGRRLFIVFVVKDSCRIRVISARDMSEKERRYYKKRKGIK